MSGSRANPRNPIGSLLLLLFAFVVPGLAQRNQQQNPSARAVDLHVRLVTTEDGVLDRSILVELQNSFGVTLNQSMSGDRGQVDFLQLPAGTYRIYLRDEAVAEQPDVNIPLDPMEGSHTEIIRVKLKEDSGNEPAFTRPSKATVSAAELKIPGNARKEFDKGNDLMQKNRLDEAAAHFEKAITLYSRYAAAYNNLGVIAIRAGDMAKARQQFTRALEADPNNSNAALNLARLVYPEHDWAKLDDLLHRGVSGDPGNVEALTMLTIADYNLKKFNDVIADTHRVHELDHAKFAVVHLLAARSYEALRNPREAMVEYKVFLKEDPTSNSAPEAQAALTRLQGGN